METGTRSAFAPIEEAIEDIRQGKFVVVVDAADRENEGDLTIAAQFATPEAINFMATHGRSRSRSIRAKGLATSSSRATSSRCARARAACSSERGRRRPPSISLALPGSTRPGSSAR
jgi:hypothetical protein